VFGGIDEVDWAALGHAYGPAEDVPGLLHGLASADPAMRELALDGMYATVHHQGDVYDSTLACIPFLLELVADGSVEDRGGIVELLTSIGGIELDGDDEDELGLEGEEFEFAANYAMAASAVTAGADVFLALVDSDDRGVRLAAPLALATLHSEPELVLGLLRERLKVERDPEVRLACVEAGGRIALRHDGLNPQVVEWLTGLTRTPPECQPSLYDPDSYGSVSPGPAADPREPGGPGTGPARGTGTPSAITTGTVAPAGPGAHPAAGPVPAVSPAGPGRPYDAGLRLSAIAQLARCAPHTLPADVVPGVTGLLKELRAEAESAPDGSRTAAAAPAAPSAAPVLLGPAPDRWEGGAQGQPVPVHSAPWTGDLLRTLHSGLGDRVDDRIALLADQLCSPDRSQRADAVRMSSGLLRTWRGDYTELVGLVGGQLLDSDPRLAEAAAVALGELFELARPAADALAGRVGSDPSCWSQQWASGPRMLGSAVTALARTGDPRVVPVLARMLEEPDAPRDLGYVLDHLGPPAAPLVPALRARLAAVELDDRLYDRAGPLLYGLTALRAAEAMPEVLRVLRGAPEYRREWVVELVLRALTAFGPAAAEAVPDLRRLLLKAARCDGGPSGSGMPGSPSCAFAARTAAALWAVEGDAASVLPVLRNALEVTDSGARRSAAAALGSMGPAATAAVPGLGNLLWAADPWTRVDAAVALWRVTGDPERAWPVLRTAWETLPFTRVPAAERLAEPLPAGAPGGPVPVAATAEGAARLLGAELSAVRRHNAVDGGYGSHDIVRDERLLALCRRALNKEGPIS
jgi:HEAT repeat protein